MALDLWTTADLIELVQDDRTAPPDGFWSGLGGFNGGDPTLSLGVFTREYLSDSPKIYFDKLPIRDRRLAPFVAPNVQGRIMSDLGRELGSFAPAYVKPKHVVTPDRAIIRRPGEPIGIGANSLTQEERFDQIVAANVNDERAMIERRWDWMACQAISFGGVTVSGEDYPSVFVDFKRDASLTFVLAGTSRWDQAGTADPLADLATARTQAFKVSLSPVSRYVFGISAWGWFIQNAKVQALLSTQNRGGSSTFANFNIGQESYAEYKGFLQGPDGGRVDMWVYSNQYVDEDGDVQEYLDPRDVLGVGNNMQGIRCFGAIQDKRAGFASVPIFPKNWDVEDPSATYTMSQSAPLFVPGNPDNSFRIRVTDTAVQ